MVSGGDAGVTPPNGVNGGGVNNSAINYGSITATKTAGSTFTTSRSGTNSPAGYVNVSCLPKKIA